MEMTKIEEKATHFLTALMDVYRQEESRELALFPPLEMVGDATEDFTAMLLAMKFIFEQLTGNDGDLFDFIHVLNKLAVQHVMPEERREHETD